MADSSNPPSDKRRHERQTINKAFESFDAFAQEYVTNISRSGIFIRSKAPLPVGTKVDLRFTVMMDEVEIIEGKGEVVRVSEAGMGVEFRELTSSSKALLEQLIALRDSNRTP